MRLSGWLFAAALVTGLLPIPASAQSEERAVGSSRTLVQSTCAGLAGTIIRTQNAAAAYNNTSFAPIPGAAIFVNVPAGTTRCIIVRFTAGAACRGTASVADFCYIRAVASGVLMFPQGFNLQTFVSEDFTPNAHAYEWTRRLGPGRHLISIQRRVASSATQFYLDDWTFEVEIRG
jgi:hypothetical protein